LRIITDREITETTSKVYRTWFDISDKLSILDIVILNYIGRYYDNALRCGLKELRAELDISKSRISKSIIRWIELGLLSEIHSTADRRRRYYTPTKKYD